MYVVYGYALIYYIPVGFLSVIPLNFIKWVLFLAAFGGSTYLIDQNLIM